MRLKLDENFGKRTQGLIQDAGHDVQTVRQQSLQGATDDQLVQQFLEALRRLPVERRLWIVETGRVRVYQLDDEEEL